MGRRRRRWWGRWWESGEDMGVWKSGFFFDRVGGLELDTAEKGKGVWEEGDEVGD